METSVLKPRDVCNIIKECGRCGVAELKFGDLELKFYVPGTEGQQVQPKFIPESDHSPIDSPENVTSVQAMTDQDLHESFIQEQKLLDDPNAHEEEAVRALFDAGNENRSTKLVV